MDFDLLILEVMEGRCLELIDVPNYPKEKVLQKLLVEAEKLEQDKEKNFVEIERIKLFVENNF